MERGLTGDELLFFNAWPRMLPIYDRLRGSLRERYPDLSVKVSKTQISFRNRHIFAMVSLPWRRMKGLPQEYLLVSFGLGAEKVSPRIVQASEPYPGRWTHHVPVTDPSEIDGELLAWIDEAYTFAALK